MSHWRRAKTAADIARIDTQRKRLFLERTSTPRAPDDPKYPHRVLSIHGTFAIARLIYASQRASHACVRTGSEHAPT
jgi:capsule polysaccharide export protein KpsE/RkpR